MPETSELNPCPFCGRTGELVSGSYHDGGHYAFVQCFFCFAKSETYSKLVGTQNDVSEMAVDAWNRRAGDAE